ncbi:polyphosphate kinase 2 family protein [Pseudoalteromonas piscicida]|uniref:Polyphosphate kinase n=1 Tax=Pseudoalteromonas piscicida TaxID=43662 RepID=A0A2A5JTA9_PSEO7|nr:polyphosphate kinase [Pseudoalteromonas piscicida]PCK32712.1 polyphosphate kinase [Pseudoalteromonas piscicida]
MTSYVSEFNTLNRGLSVKPPVTHPAMDSKKHYKRELKYWQTQLQHVQQAYFHQGKRAILVFEGWDAAGKGGAIRRMTEKLDPRGFKVFPIAKPDPEEQGRHYLYRFQTKLPPLGTMTILDRSYYGRVLVERVEGFASEHEWLRAYQEINEFERLLVDDNVRIVKVFLHISEDEQLKRFTERLNNPYKRWKLTEEDIRNRKKRQEYEQAIDDMFAKTDTNLAPWHVILGEHKWYARVQVLKTVVNALSDGVDISPPPIDKAVVKLAKSQLGIVQKED